MNAKSEADTLNPPCSTTELLVDSTAEYCTRWLAMVSAAQLDETSTLAQGHPFTESRLEVSTSDTHDSSPAGGASSRRAATHRRTGFPALPPSSAPSHVDATPEPELECLASVPYNGSPRTRLDETFRYEKKPRRKTRPDRYDTNRQHRDTTSLSRRERRERKREKLRSRREIMTNFYSSATENRHVLMKPALATGAFVNGRGSVSTPLADLTFNELTFPITQKAAPRATSPQPPNGARKRPTMQIQTPPEQIDKHSKQPPDVVEACPDTPTPPPRQGRGENPTQPLQRNDENDPNTSLGKDNYSRNTIPRPILRYVDSGVDTMSHAGNFEPGNLADVHHVQIPPAENQNIQQPNCCAPYYTPLPVYLPQYYWPSLSANGIYPQPGLMPGSGRADHVPPHYPNQYIDDTPIQPAWIDYEDQNRDINYTTPISDIYPAPTTDLDEYMLASPVPEVKPLYKPDEETKAFWRPNFLR